MQALESASPSPCKTPDIFIDSTAQTINQEKMKNPGMRSNFQQIASDCFGQHTQNPVLREVVCHAETRKKHPKESKLYHTAWNHTWIRGNLISSKSYYVNKETSKTVYSAIFHSYLNYVTTVWGKKEFLRSA